MVEKHKEYPAMTILLCEKYSELNTHFRNVDPCKELSTQIFQGPFTNVD